MSNKTTDSVKFLLRKLLYLKQVTTLCISNFFISIWYYKYCNIETYVKGIFENLKITRNPCND